MGHINMDNKQEIIVMCREYINRALAGLSTLDIGPIDYNIMATVDDLLSAIRLIESMKVE